MSAMKWPIVGLCAAALAFAGYQLSHNPTSPTSSSDQQRLSDSSGGNDWAAFGRTFGEQHYSPLTEIKAENVKDIGLAWSAQLGPGNPASVPLAVDGILYYVTGLSIVAAVDIVSGKELWRYDPNAGEAAGAKLRQGWNNRGLAYWEGKIFNATRDGRLISIDAKTGKELWSTLTVDPGDGRYITGAPRAFNGKIIIGHGGADSAAVRGYVSAYDAESGKQVWRFHTVPGNPADGFEDEAQKMAASTWDGEWWKYGGGGTVWNAFSYDEESNTVFLGTGNGAPWNHKIRSKGKGDNLFLCSIVALDADTGKYKWHFQVNPGETWDYNASMDMHLADIEVDGKMRKVLMQAPKNGFFYVLDRTNGEFISASRIAKVTWATGIDPKTGRPIEAPGARFPNGQDFELWPSSAGAHSWTPSAYSPQTKLVYVPIMEKGVTYSDRGIDTANWKATPGNLYSFGVNIVSSEMKDPLDGTGWLVAIDPRTQKVRWRVKNDSMWNSGVVATGSNLVIQGEGGGALNVYDATNGKKLWSFDTHAPIVSAPITYRAGGKQYISVMVGMGGSAAVYSPYQALAVDYRGDTKRLLTFVLGGTAKLPDDPKYKLAAFDDPQFRPNPALAAKGGGAYELTCGFCHGMGVRSTGAAPDLRGSPVVMDNDAFRSVVHGGALQANGMPRFDNLSQATLDEIRFYIRTRAAEVR